MILAVKISKRRSNEGDSRDVYAWTKLLSVGRSSIWSMTISSRSLGTRCSSTIDAVGRLL